MKLINVTNSHSRMVMRQLETTDAEVVKVYSAGNNTVIYTIAPTHHEILIKNLNRSVLKSEEEEIKAYFLKKIDPNFYDASGITTVEAPGVIEISVPIKKKNSV